MKKFNITSTIELEVESKEDLVNQLKVCRKEIRNDGGIARALLDEIEIEEIKI